MKPKLLHTLPESDRQWAFYCDISPDGKHFVYSLENNPGESFVCDGKKSPKFDALLGPWYADCGTLIYKEGKPKKWRWHIGDEVHAVFDQSDNPVFSPDGKHHCYTAKKGKTWQLVVDGEKRKETYDFVSNPVWSPDGKKIAFAAKSGGKEFVVVDDQQEPPCVEPSNLVFSPDGSKIAYLAKAPPMTQYMVICGSFKSDKLDLPTTPKFTPKGELVFSFSHTLKRGQGLQIGDRQIQTKDNVKDSFFNVDGTLLAHVESPGGERKSYLVPASKGTREELPNFHEGIFHPSGKIAIVADKMTQQEAMSSLTSRFVLCINGKQSEEYDLLKHPRFSDDGKTVSFGAVRGRELWWVEMETR